MLLLKERAPLLSVLVPTLNFNGERDVGDFDTAVFALELAGEAAAHLVAAEFDDERGANRTTGAPGGG